MKRIGILLYGTVLFLTGCKSQLPVSANTATAIDSFTVVSDLDLEITETSGLETFNGKLITHNDSDATPTIYFLNTDGIIEDQVTYKNMVNIDWEDIAIGNGSLYIADIGNNYGDRTDLTVYKLAIDSLNVPQAIPEKMNITYSDQKLFERDKQQHPFDGEAIVVVEDKLLLFSKDWINFTTTVYEIDDSVEKQALVRSQQINVNGLITGATTNGTGRVILCGYNSSLEAFVVVLEKKGKQFELTQRIDLPLENGAQIEAVTFYDRTENLETYYLTSEAVNIQLGEDEATTNGQLYRLTLKN